MTPRKGLGIILLAIFGFVFTIGGVLVNLAILFNNEERSLDDPLFAPPAIAIISLGVLCFLLGTIFGWKQKGVRSSIHPPSFEPKSMVLRMPSNRDYPGHITLKVRNGDNHDFQTPAEIMKILSPGLIGTAKIQGSNLLEFTPDKEQPNLKSINVSQTIEARAKHQP